MTARRRDIVRDIVRELGNVTLRAAWTIGALAIAFGSAGLVATLDHLPGTAARAELTWAGDRALEPELDAAVGDLRAIATDLDRLSDVGKDALVALVARNTEELSTLIDQGTELTLVIERAAADLRASVAVLPGTGAGEELRLSAGMLARRSAVGDVAAQIGGLRKAWARVEGGAVRGVQLIGLLEDHDAAVVAAAADGRRRRYNAALRDLNRADALMVRARRLEAQLRNTTDVATLDEWLNRSDAYDRALRRLYTALRASAGRVTDDVREAFAQEQAARELLPGNTNPLVIIMNDIAQASVNDALIAIDTARGELDEAVDDLEATQGVAGTGAVR